MTAQGILLVLTYAACGYIAFWLLVGLSWFVWRVCSTPANAPEQSAVHQGPVLALGENLESEFARRELAVRGGPRLSTAMTPVVPFTKQPA